MTQGCIFTSEENIREKEKMYGNFFYDFASSAKMGGVSEQSSGWQTQYMGSENNAQWKGGG